MAQESEEKDRVLGLVHRMLTDEEAGWSIGTFGAIAEFQNVEGDATAEVGPDSEGGLVVSDRGAVRVALAGNVGVVAYEGLSQRSDAWTQGIAFCLPLDSAAMGRRTVLTELGPDKEAIRENDRTAVVFDLGLGALHVDFCVRSNEPGLIKSLRKGTGRNVFDPSSPALNAIKAASPHRICASRLGRIEVYQHIGSHNRNIPTPPGPHTHLLPDLLRTGRTASANTLIPEDWVSGLTLYPGNPVIDRLGRSRSFVTDLYRSFQRQLELFGLPGYMEEKARITAAVERTDIGP